jgi:hypothetical protein
MPLYRLTILFIAFISCVIILASSIPINSVSIGLTNLPHPGYYQIYLLQDRLYEEKHSQRQGFSSYSQHAEITFLFKHTFKNIRRIRFDLGDRASHHVITRVAFGFQIFNRKIHLGQWPLQEFAAQASPLHSITQIRFETNRLHVIAGGEDPHFDIPFDNSTIQKAIPLVTLLGIKLAMLTISGVCALGIFYINIIWCWLIRLWHIIIRFGLKVIIRQVYPVYPSGFFYKNRYWLIAGVILFIALNFLRSWDNLTHAGLYMEDTAHYFNHYYSGEKPLSEVIRKPHGYINLINNMYAWMVAKTDVRIQPTLYLIFSILIGSMAVSSIVFSGLFTQRLTILVAPTVLGLSGMNHIGYYFTLTYVMYTVIILLLCLLFYPVPRSKTKLVGLALLMNIFIWSGPYSVLTVPVGLLLLLAFKDARKNGLLIVLFISTLVYYSTVDQGTTSLPNILYPPFQSYISKVLFEEIFFLGLLGSVTWVKVILFFIFLSSIFYRLRDDIIYIKIALILLSLVVGALAPFVLSIKFILYGQFKLCHILISIFFWLVFLLYSLDKIVSKIRMQLPIMALLYIVLMGVVIFDNYRHPEKGSFALMRNIPAYLDTIHHYEQLDLDAANQYLILKTRGKEIFDPRVRVGSKRQDAIQIGSDDHMASYNKQFIVDPE